MALVSKIFRASLAVRCREKIKKYRVDREFDFSDDSDDGTKTYPAVMDPLGKMPPGMNMDFDPVPNSFFYYASGMHIPRVEQPTYLSFAQDDKIWHIFNASSITLGRMANRISQILQGKHRPYYTHDRLQPENQGDFVIVVNGKYPLILGTKGREKIYRSHSGKPGSMKELNIRQILSKSDWKRVVRQSVRGMLPNNKLLEQYLKRLHIYPEIYHDFENLPQFIQQPLPDINKILNHEKVLEDPASKIVFSTSLDNLPDQLKGLKYEPNEIYNVPFNKRPDAPKEFSLIDKKKVKKFWKTLRRFKVYDHRSGKYEIK